VLKKNVKCITVEKEKEKNKKKSLNLYKKKPKKCFSVLFLYMKKMLKKKEESVNRVKGTNDPYFSSRRSCFVILVENLASKEGKILFCFFLFITFYMTDVKQHILPFFTGFILLTKRRLCT